jgi:hypothetical protein
VEFTRFPRFVDDPLLLECVFAILMVDLLPIPTAVGLPFSLRHHPPSIGSIPRVLVSTSAALDAGRRTWVPPDAEPG